MGSLWSLSFDAGTAAVLAALLYVAFAMLRVARHRRAAGACAAPVSVLKPLCGLEAGLYENLSSFCEQDHPAFQIVFGVREAGDPAVAIVHRVMEEHPDLDLALVIDERVHGSNLKVSNVANLCDHARHGLLVIADSDMRVERGYLRAVTAPFADPEVGAVTALYKGTAAAGIPSALGALFINDWFLPSVLVAIATAPLRFCLGATMAVRREALQAIGGFEALASDLADDYLLGRRVAELGYRVALADCVVENVVEERSFGALFHHVLRWARTVRSVRPAGYAFSFVTYTVPVSLLFLLLSDASAPGWSALAAALALRLGLHYQVRRRFGVRGPARPWLVPACDLLAFAVWAASFLGQRVRWRERDFVVDTEGRLVPEGNLPP